MINSSLLTGGTENIRPIRTVLLPSVSADQQSRGRILLGSMDAGSHFSSKVGISGEKPAYPAENKAGFSRTVPEIIDPVFAKTSPKRSFCMTEHERIGLVFVKTGSINSGPGNFSASELSFLGFGLCSDWRNQQSV